MPYCTDCGTTWEDWESPDGECPGCAARATADVVEKQDYSIDVESELWWAQYDEEREEIQKEARRLGVAQGFAPQSL
jgi:hypothetical protein